MPLTGQKMQLTRPLSQPRRRSRDASSRTKRAVNPKRERYKKANVNQDEALYHCACGYVFKAPVTTSVTCPNCGAPQAW